MAFESGDEGKNALQMYMSSKIRSLEKRAANSNAGASRQACCGCGYGIPGGPGLPGQDGRGGWQKIFFVKFGEQTTERIIGFRQKVNFKNYDNTHLCHQQKEPKNN